MAFVKGESGNPRGKTPEDKRKEAELAVKAQSITEQWIDAIMQANAKAPTEDAKLATLNPSTMKLIESVQDRAWGKAKQAIDIESPEGTMRPTVIELVAVRSESNEGED